MLMKRSSYGERDYAFGQAMLSLRTALGLTQAGLAKHLGVSRRAVGEWEVGGSYPKAEHLKALMALAIQHQAFPAGREAEEIRAFWQAARQKLLLDESWLSALLSQQLPRLTLVAPLPVEQSSGIDHVLASPAVGGRLRPGYEGYARLLRRVGETRHSSCLLLTSREKPAELRALEGSRSPVRALRLVGLEAAACEQLLAEHELVGSPEEQVRLVEGYAGNPLALTIVAQTIAELFGGEIGPFLAGGTAVLGSLADLLDDQGARLSALEPYVLSWLAIVREPVALEELRAVLVAPLPGMQILEAVEGLRRRSLIEPGHGPGSFTLQSVVLEYVTAELVAQASSEIQQGRLARLIEHGLSQAQARE